jgi:NAD(P)-dependent dehydrogenase (short-subunit alcohol dehydrogenase family)
MDKHGPQVLLVTGGGRGIGAATAKLAAQQGWQVAVNYTANSLAADEVVRQIRADGGNAVAVRADVADEAQVLAMFEHIDAKFGPVTGLVNNAGVVDVSARLDEMDLARWRRMFDINVIGTFLCAREAVRRMSTRHGGSGGAIVNVSSAASRLGSPAQYVDYAAAKGGGLPNRVNDLKHLVPMQRGGTADEVAQAIVWLLSDAASYTTMSLLDVSGGR